MNFLFISIIASCVVSSLSIDCIVCDSYLSCTTQTKEFCPDSLSCYTVFERHVAVAKGCASSCQKVPAANHHGRSCKICDYDECNSDSSTLVAGDELDQLVRGNEPDIYRPRNNNQGYDSIGGGVVPERHNHQGGPGIGHGVSPNKSSSSLMTLLYLPISLLVGCLAF